MTCSLDLGQEEAPQTLFHSQADSRKVPGTEKRPMDGICEPGESIQQSSSRRVVVGVEAVRS